MRARKSRGSRSLWARHDLDWRQPAEVVSPWRDAVDVDRELLAGRARGDWWDVLTDSRLTLLVTREYEHLVMALSAARGRPRVTYWQMPHPSGLAVDRRRRVLYVASTRNPNQVYTFARVEDRILIPVSSSIYPGRLYLHDLAVIRGKLYGNAVGQNAVVTLGRDGLHRIVWWPRCIETRSGRITNRNHLQLNSIAAGRTLRDSYFSASADRISVRRPGHKNFTVDGRGVIFSGRTREPVARGLTRPHSARVHRRKVWVDNSGYGQLGIAENGGFTPVAQLPGWTRGLSFHRDIAFVGTSRVIPEFRHYAPGLDVDRSVCGVHAIDTKSGRVLGSFLWPSGNQVFGVEWIEEPSEFPFVSRGRRGVDAARVFYSFSIERNR